MITLSARTQAEMLAGAKLTEKVTREEYVDMLLTKHRDRLRKSLIGPEVIVRVSQDGQGWSDEDLILREAYVDFPSPKLAAQLMLVCG